MKGIRDLRMLALIAAIGLGTFAVVEAAALVQNIFVAGQAVRLKTITETTVSTTTSTSFVNLVSTNQAVPTGQTAYLVIRFSGESLCEASGGWCSVRILVNGVEAHPQAGSNFAFDTPSAGSDWESHSMDRTSQLLSGGTHTITVQRAVVSGATSFSLDDWQLTIEQWRVS